MKFKFEYCVTGRTAQLINNKASSFFDSVYITKGARTVNAKSLLGLLSLSINAGDDVTVEVYSINNQAVDEAETNEFVSFIANLF